MKYGRGDFRPLAVGMGEAVAKRTVLRRKDDLNLETWGDVADRVSFGNVSLIEGNLTEECSRLRAHIANGSILMSGRSLQHGDSAQSKRNLEIFTNCASAATSFLAYYLLLNGSGVGRSYDDKLCLVDWRKMPHVYPVMSEQHKDFDHHTMESLNEAKHKHGAHCIIHEVEDSREGWAKAVELLETMAFSGKHSKDVLLLDFSKVRPSGAPIKGMQNRPSSGPGPLMNAIRSIATIKGSHIPNWMQSMYVDHYLAESVLVGGSRRSARIAIKHWRDPSILDFIKCKNNYLDKTRNFLWSANNTVAVTADFWKECTIEGSWANQVFMLLSENAYYWGEPGIVNLDKLVVNNSGLVDMLDGKYAESQRLKPSQDGVALLSKIAKVSRTSQYQMIVNPCQPGYIRLLTVTGPRKLETLKVGDIVWTGMRWAALKKVWSTGTKEVVRYWLSNGTYVDMTPNHRVVEDGVKVEIQNAHKIDRITMVPLSFGMPEGENRWKGFALPAGMILGDGSMQKNGGVTAYLNIGVNDGDMELAAMPFTKEIIENKGKRLAKLTLGFRELHLNYAPVWERRVSDFWKATDRLSMCQFLRGLYTTNGSVVAQGSRITLKTSSQDLAQDVAEMLEWLGLRTYITTNKPSEVEFENGTYICKQSYDVNTVEVAKFAKLIGFEQDYKMQAIDYNWTNRQGWDVQVVREESLGKMKVFDYTVDAEEHTVAQKGLFISNCGEISLNRLGGYCSIGDIVPYHCETIDETEEAARLQTRALIRINTMDCVYHREVNRTNRIGVSLTGIHEFAWKFFKFGFRDLINEEKAKPFWQALARLSRAVKDEARDYSRRLERNVPHTNTTIKPAGTTSKLFGVTEGAHLPSMREYIRWVQFRSDDPLVTKYKRLGYRIRELKNYKGTTIVGFPTQPEICKLGMGDKLVTAAEATPEEQYRWLMLLEKYWIRGVDAQGNALPEDTGNQVSYTLKYKPELVSLEQFRDVLVRYQSKVKCCSVMKQSDEEEGRYEYQPEQAVNLEDYNAYIKAIKKEVEVEEDIDKVHIDCAGGACPVDIKGKKDTVRVKA